MKTIKILVLVSGLISLCLAEDNGGYHPGLHSGIKYHNFHDNRYKSLVQANSKYGSIYNPYYPLHQHQALNRGLASPLQVNYGDSPAIQAVNGHPTTASYRTPVAPITTTYRPFVYSTAKPFIVTKSPSVIYKKTVLDSAANVIRQDSSSDEHNYHYAFETDNGIAAEQYGANDVSVSGAGGTRVRGFYEYIGDDGIKYRVDYIADENGYRASGAHLPRVPGTN